MTLEERERMRREGYVPWTGVYSNLEYFGPLLDALDAAESELENEREQVIREIAARDHHRADRDRWREIAGELVEALRAIRQVRFSAEPGCSHEQWQADVQRIANALDRYDEMAK